MTIRIIRPINVGRDGRQRGYRSLGEIKLEVVDITSRIDALKVAVGDMTMDLASVDVTLKSGVRKRRTLQGTRSGRAPKNKSKESKKVDVDIDKDDIQRNMSIFRTAESVRKQLRNARAELNINRELQRTREYKQIKDSILEQERELSNLEKDAFRTITRAAKRQAPTRFKKLTSDMVDDVHENMDGLYESSQQTTLVDVADKGQLVFVHYLKFDGVKADDTNFRDETLVVAATHLVGSRDPFRINLLTRFRHPGTFDPGTSVASAEEAVDAVMAKIRAQGLLQTLTDDEISPLPPGAFKGKSFPGVTHLELDDDDLSVTFTIRKGTEISKVLPQLRASVHALIKPTHPDHLLRYDVDKKRNKVSFQLAKDQPYMADRATLDRMAKDLDMTPEQRKSLRDWFVENMTNVMDAPAVQPQADKPTRKATRPDAKRDDKQRERLHDIEIESLNKEHQDQLNELLNAHKDQRDEWMRDGSPDGTIDVLKEDQKKEVEELKRAQQDEMDDLKREQVERASAAPRVTFGRVTKDRGDQSVVIFIDRKRAGTMLKAFDGTEWYTYGDEHPLLYDSDLGTNLREARRAVQGMVMEMHRSRASTGTGKGIQTLAAVDTTSPDGEHLFQPHHVHISFQRSVNRTLERLASHFKGNYLIPGDPLYGIAHAIPGVHMDSRIVLLTKPDSVFVEHSILLNKAGDKPLVDHNTYLLTEWVPANPAARDPSKTGLYKVVRPNGTTMVLKPRKVMTVGKFIRESETYYSVRKIQLDRQRTKATRKPKPKEESSAAEVTFGDMVVTERPAIGSVRKQPAREVVVFVDGEPADVMVSVGKGQWFVHGEHSAMYEADLGTDMELAKDKVREIARRKAAKRHIVFKRTGQDKIQVLLNGKEQKSLVFSKGYWRWFDDRKWRDRDQACKAVYMSIMRNGPLTKEVASRNRRKGGILGYMGSGDNLQVLVVHPGGPLYDDKDAGYWSLPKGGCKHGEKYKAAAIRELAEETGIKVSHKAPMKPLKGDQANYPGLKVWAVDMSKVHGAANTRKMSSSTFKMEWEGRKQVFPEIDEYRWASVAEARRLLDRRQRGYLDELIETVAA